MNESDLSSNEHYLSSSEKKAWKKFRPVRNLNPWLLRYRCSALPPELTSQLGAGQCVGPKYTCEVVNKRLWIYGSHIFEPAPSWLVSSVGRALHRYRRGHGFKFRTGLNLKIAFIHVFTMFTQRCSWFLQILKSNPTQDAGLHFLVVFKISKSEFWPLPSEINRLKWERFQGVS